MGNTVHHTFVRSKKSGQNKVHDARTADRVVRFCPQCKKCYETVNKNCYYYTDFPTYGKKKVACKRCNTG